MALVKFYSFCAIGILFILGTLVSAKPAAFSQSSEERERNLDSLGGGHMIRSLDSLGGGNLLRAIYRNERSRDFQRTGRGLDSLSGAAFGTAKRSKLDSLSGMTFGSAKRNFDEIDRSNFGNFVKKNFDEIDRSDFDRFVKKRETSPQSQEENPE